MKVTVFYTGYEPDFEKALIREAGVEPVQVGDQIADNPDAQDLQKVADLNHRMPAHVNRRFLSFVMEDGGGDRFARYIDGPGLAIVIAGRKPAECPTCGKAHTDAETDEQDFSHMEDFVKIPEFVPGPALATGILGGAFVAGLTAAPPAAAVAAARFMKIYPCGCNAGPGPADIPDYCPEHGKAGEIAECQTVPFKETPATTAVSGDPGQGV